jgi:hypothetical protein
MAVPVQVSRFSKDLEKKGEGDAFTFFLSYLHQNQRA